jgi:hypothetical protein
MKFGRAAAIRSTVTDINDWSFLFSCFVAAEMEPGFRNLLQGFESYIQGPIGRNPAARLARTLQYAPL